MALDNNPLKQYFRRPVIHLRLPSGGKYYPEGAIDMPETGELPVYSMTAIDEITAKTPDALYNGSAIADLIRSCIPNIKNPWTVISMDLDAILVAIRIASTGSDMELPSDCPNCNETANYKISLGAMLQQLTPGNYDEIITIGDLQIKLRPLTYKEMNTAGLMQVEIQQLFNRINALDSADERAKQTQDGIKKITALTMELLANAIEYIQTPTMKVMDKTYILDYLQNCDKTAYIEIRDTNTKLKTSSEMKPIHITCDNCKHEYDQPFTLNATDFFD